jgi:hypothetical protein
LGGLIGGFQKFFLFSAVIDFGGLGGQFDGQLGDLEGQDFVSSGQLSLFVGQLGLVGGGGFIGGGFLLL